MIQEVRVSTLEELMPLLSEQEYRPDLGRNRSPFVYRGMTNADFRMVTSLATAASSSGTWSRRF